MHKRIFINLLQVSISVKQMYGISYFSDLITQIHYVLHINPLSLRSLCSFADNYSLLFCF